MQIAEERLFVAREREEADRHGNADVDADLTAVGVACKFTRKIAALGINHRAVGIGVRVHNRKAFFEVLAAFDAKHRAEHLVAADGHIFGDMVENRGADEIAVFIAFDFIISAVEHQFCALGDAFVDVGKDFFIVLFIGNRAEFRGFIPRRADFNFRSLFFQLCDEFVGNRFFDNAAGKRHTALTGAAVSGVDNAGNGSFERGVRHNQRVVFRLAKRLAAFARRSGTLINF